MQLGRLLRRAGLGLGALAAVLAAGFLWQRSTFIDPRPSAIMVDRHGEFLAQIGRTGLGYGYWRVTKVPDRVAAAILALEDRRFWQHPGVDPLAILRAAATNWQAGRRLSGASTLAMQVARMQHPSPRGYAAKTLEAATALVMTARYGRQAVLQQYLRIVPFGQDSHGIAHAASWYFDKPVEDLSWAEIAFLSAIPQSPGADNPDTESGRRRITARARTALARLREGGVLGEVEFSQAQQDLDALLPRAHPERPPEAVHAILHVEALAAEAAPMEQIRSTLDAGLERRLAKLARDRLDALRGEGAAQVAVILADRPSREVLALVGSGRWATADAGKIDYAFRYRSPGSTLKPFVFAEALETRVIGPATVLLDAPDNGTGIDNADRRFLGPLLPGQALGNSRNVPAASLVRMTGVARTYWFLAALGLHDEQRPADRYGLTLTVGGLPTELDRLVTAYGALANEGQLAPLRWYREEALPPPHRVLSAETSSLITGFLADPMARLPSFARMGATEYPFPVAIKTGTSQGYRDAWVAAYTDRYVIGVWIGRPDGRPMNGLSGASSAALVARDILLDLHHAETDGLSDGSFKPPAGTRPPPACAAIASAGESGCTQAATERLSTIRPEPAARPDPPTPRLRIASPLNRSIFIRNPETPADIASLPFRVTASSAQVAVAWYVDGTQVGAADPGTTFRWPVRPGRHIIRARGRSGDLESPPIEVTVQ
ncbi:MAG TPA: transglycosylase domain-containing protein [Stellaceae bacterium]|nr:transglycosylase domain-containing protein [Stellaceae bacterium]